MFIKILNCHVLLIKKLIFVRQRFIKNIKKKLGRVETFLSTTLEIQYSRNNRIWLLITVVVVTPQFTTLFLCTYSQEMKNVEDIVEDVITDMKWNIKYMMKVN